MDKYRNIFIEPNGTEQKYFIDNYILPTLIKQIKYPTKNKIQPGSHFIETSYTKRILNYELSNETDYIKGFIRDLDVEILIVPEQNSNKLKVTLTGTTDFFTTPYTFTHDINYNLFNVIDAQCLHIYNLELAKDFFKNNLSSVYRYEIINGCFYFYYKNQLVISLAIYSKYAHVIFEGNRIFNHGDQFSIGFEEGKNILESGILERFSQSMQERVVYRFKDPLDPIIQKSLEYDKKIISELSHSLNVICPDESLVRSVFQIIKENYQ